MNKNNIYTLEDRGILYVHGEDVSEYLQNIITNDISKVTDNMSCFASLLTPQGKYLFDFIIIKHKKGYFVDCEKTQIDQLYKQLKVYKLRSRVEILNLSNEFVVAAISKEKFLSLEGSKEENGFTVKYREDPVVLDPRNKELGGRLVINLEKLYLSIEKLELKTSESKIYYNFSFKLGIPPLHTDQLKNQLFGIECNFDELNGIDFKKGCYVGQENTARIKLKNKLNKRLLPIEVINGEIKVGEAILTNNNEIGKILIDNEYPFGLIKHRSEFFDLEKKFQCKNAVIKIKKPEWIKYDN
jgi:hypothetical protein